MEAYKRVSVDDLSIGDAVRIRKGIKHFPSKGLTISRTMRAKGGEVLLVVAVDASDATVKLSDSWWYKAKWLKVAIN